MYPMKKETFWTISSGNGRKAGLIPSVDHKKKKKGQEEAEIDYNVLTASA